MGKEKIFDAFEAIISYNGHYDWLKVLRDNMEEFSEKRKGDYYYNPFPPTMYHSEEHTIWMLLVGMFGDWGTSIRSGWIEDIKGCIEFIDATCKRMWEEDERVMSEENSGGEGCEH